MSALRSPKESASRSPSCGVQDDPAVVGHPHGRRRTWDASWVMGSTAPRRPTTLCRTSNGHAPPLPTSARGGGGGDGWRTRPRLRGRSPSTTVPSASTSRRSEALTCAKCSPAGLTQNESSLPGSACRDVAGESLVEAEMGEQATRGGERLPPVEPLLLDGLEGGWARETLRPWDNDFLVDFRHRSPLSHPTDGCPLADNSVSIK